MLCLSSCSYLFSSHHVETGFFFLNVHLFRETACKWREEQREKREYEAGIGAQSQEL